MTRYASCLALASLLAACSGTSSPSSSTLGITSVEVARDATGFTARAFDAQHIQLAQVSYLRGPVVVDDFGPEPVDGVALEVEVKDQKLRHTSAGVNPLALPVETESQAEVLSFLADPRVEPLLVAVDVRFVAKGPRSQIDEQPLASCTYAASGSCGGGDCFEFTGSPVQQNRCCSTSHQAVNRECTGNPGGTNGCGSVGPLGCSVCWSQSYSQYCFTNATTGGIFTENRCWNVNNACGSDLECCSRNCLNGRCSNSLPQ